MKIWSDNSWIDSTDSSSSEGFQYGYAFFETMLVKNNVAFNQECHVNRLEKSIEKLTAEKFFCDRFSIQESIKKLPKGLWVFKLLVYKDGSEFRMEFFQRKYPYTSEKLANGFSLLKSNVIKSSTSLLLQHKTTNYLENYLERQRALKLGYNDVYFSNNESIITECSSSNLFIKQGNKLITSPIVAGLLPGVVRSKILGLNSKIDLNVMEQDITPMMLKKADNVFVSNSLIGMVGINKVDNLIYEKSDSLIEFINDMIGFKI